jgi:hypothetical protein
MSKIVSLTLAGAALAAAGVAAAQPAEPAGVSNEIVREQVQTRAGQAFDRLDRNRDGRLDQGDRQARQQAMFERLDADHNGAISPAEFAAVRERLTERRGQLRDRFERPGGRRGPGPMAGAPRGGAGLGAQADANRDGTLTRDEVAAAALARFDRGDANHAG